jgi:organic hydroperoxide reductase OsmC/OhrA
VCRADVPGIDPDAFAEHAEASKGGCPVSKALAGRDDRARGARLALDI